MACSLCGDPKTTAGMCQPCKDATDKLTEDLKDGS